MSRALAILPHQICCQYWPPKAAEAQSGVTKAQAHTRHISSHFLELHAGILFWPQQQSSHLFWLETMSGLHLLSPNPSCEHKGRHRPVPKASSWPIRTYDIATEVLRNHLLVQRRLSLARLELLGSMAVVSFQSQWPRPVCKSPELREEIYPSTSTLNASPAELA